MKSAAKVEMTTTAKGVTKRSTISGTMRWSFFSSHDEKKTTKRTAMMPPRRNEIIPEEGNLCQTGMTEDSSHDAA